MKGYFVFGIDRDRKFDLKITKILDNKKEIIVKKIYKRKYNIQRIDGLPENKVTPPESVYKRIKEENNKIGEARGINSDLNFFKDNFIMPVDGIISGVYGSQRILNGKPRWPHYGIDIAAKKGTPIKSSGRGIVTLAEKDLYYTGGTIIMDHGHGISTIYSHLEDVLVLVGDQINQGDIIGTVGSTGRSTGPHLDFRVNWFQTRLDPMSVIN
jgi:murein DD-endopeptidase MepM/ murein hydrolase activator NlpD